MAKYISVEIAKKALADSNLIPRYAENCKPITDRIIDSLTAADVEPVRHGRWLKCFEDWRQQIEGSKCSACGFEYYGTGISRFRYCPGCGAKMDGGA